MPVHRYDQDTFNSDDLIGRFYLPLTAAMLVGGNTPPTPEWSKLMYETINKQPFVYNKRTMTQLSTHKSLWNDYKNAFGRIHDIAVVSPISGYAEFVRRDP